jgi:hypothetical protein
MKKYTLRSKEMDYYLPSQKKKKINYGMIIIISEKEL